jgi:hypothetical protein
MARNKKTDKDKELSLEEAQNIIKRLAHPKHVNQEEKLLKDAAAIVLKETQPEFEFGDDEDEEVKIDTSSVDKATSDLTKPPGFLEQVGSQIAAIGPAGVIALSSAAYFQVDTVVEETRVVQQVAEEKWEEVKFEHPNINWDDPLAGFTTILGMGDIEIDLDPPEPTTPTGETPSDDTTKGNLNANKSTTISEESEEGGEKGTPENEDRESGTNDEPVEDDNKEEAVEEKEEPKKKKKGFFAKLLGDDDEEEQEEEQEESEEPIEESTEEESEEPADEESEEPAAEEESNEPEPEAEEEQVEEKPKKKSGGLFSALFGGDDEEESEEPDDEPREEPQQDDTIPDEQAEEETVTEPEAEANDGEVAGGESTAEPVANADTAESNGVKKSSGGGLLSLFGFNNSEEEVVEESEISADEEPTIEVAGIDSESEAPPISTDEEVEVEDIIIIDEIDDIKPHSMVAETEIEVVPEVEVEVTEVNIADVLVNADVVIDDIEIAVNVEEVVQIDDVVEETVIETVLTPIEGTPGTVIVSPAGPVDWSGIFGPSAPGYDNGDRDATPI